MSLSKLRTKLNIPGHVSLATWLRRRLSPYKRIIVTAVAVAAAAFITVAAVRFLIPLIKSAGTLISQPFTTLNVLKNPYTSLKDTAGRTNILILGRGGAFHEAADLTDTIILVSLNHQTQKVSAISLPRDIWIDSMKAKINTAYYYGQQKNPDGGGFALARDAVFQVTDLPVHYTVLVDFEGFIKAIDLVGGVDIEVDRSFTDPKYPIELANGNKPTPKPGQTLSQEDIYETIRFEAGIQHMDGATALKFARSRNSEDPEEGTDFARAKRQQKVLVALAQKMKTRETALNTQRISELRQIFDDYTNTDLGDAQLLGLGRIGIGLDLAQIQSITLDTGTDDQPGLLTNPPTSKYGQWVLEPASSADKPQANDWQEIHQFIQQQLKQ